MNSKNKLTILQWLRGIASVAVVYYHLPVSMSFGAIGVDLFIVISGFIMAMLMDRTDDWKAFAVARARRIIPLYWLCTLVAFLALNLGHSMLPVYRSETINLTNLIKSLLFIPYLNGTGLFRPILEVGWTLNLEIYFYLICSISIILKRLINPHFLALFILIFIYLISSFFKNLVPVLSFFSESIILEFGIGVLVYLFSLKLNRFRLNIEVSIFFVVVINLLAFLVEYNCGLDYRLILVGPLAAILVMVVVISENNIGSEHSLIDKILGHLGDSSYSLYLTHFFVIASVKYLLDGKLHVVKYNSSFGIFLTFFGCLCVASLCFFFIEKPMLTFFSKKIRQPYSENSQTK